MQQDKTGHPLWQAILAVVVLAAGVTTAIVLILAKDRPQQENPTPVGPLVEVQTVQHRDAPVVVHGFGTVRPRITVQVVPQVAGTIVEAHPALRAGGFFSDGETLIQIDRTDFDLAVQEAAAQLAEADASIENTTANVQDFEARLEEAQLDAARVRDLFRQNSTTRRELEKADLAVRRAEAQLSAARALGNRDAAAKRTAEAKLKIAQVRLARTRLAVPFDGRVMSKQVDVGQHVMAGQTLATVYGTDAMEFVVPLEDWQLAWFDVPGRGQTRTDAIDGAKVRVEADFAGKPRQWQGRVVRLEGQIDPISRMANVVVEVTEPLTGGDDPVLLTPGMFVSVHIDGNTLRDVAAVPRRALRMNGRVWIADNQSLRFEDVQVVRTQRDTVFVRGLSEGQQVVVSALDVATDGMQIRVPDTGSNGATARVETKVGEN